MDGSENSNGLLEHQWPPLDGRIRNLEMLRAEIFEWSVFNSLSAQVAYIERKERTEFYHKLLFFLKYNLSIRTFY